MTTRSGAFGLLAVLLVNSLDTAVLRAQEDPATEQTRKRLLEVLSLDPSQRAARLRESTARLQLAQTPRQATATSVLMPEQGDVIRLRFAHSTLELRRRSADGAEATCGSWHAMMPGPFDARALGPHEIVVAMQTGNAGPQTTVLRFTRTDAKNDFELAAQAVVGTIEWSESATARTGAPQDGCVVACQPASGSVTMAFSFEGLSRVVLAEISMENAKPAVGIAADGRRWRTVVMPAQPVAVKGELLGEGSGLATLDVDGARFAFVRQAGDLGRQSGVRVHVRDRNGRWQQAVEAAGVRVEPEFVAWRDADGSVCLTTPISGVRDGTATPAAPQPEFVQTLRTFRMDAKDPSRWTIAPQQFAWTGSLHLGQQLTVVSTVGTPATMMLETTSGELVEVHAATTTR